MDASVVEKAVKGDLGVLSFLRDIALVLHGWDDLIDRDKPISDDYVHEIFYTALVALPSNAFYRDHVDTLLPVLINAITNWRIANRFEREPDLRTKDGLQIAFILRSTYVDLVTMSAAIAVSPQWAVEVGPAVRLWAHSEKFEGYLNSLAKETEARSALGEKSP